MKRHLPVVCIFLITTGAALAAEPEFAPLFNGKDLSDFEVCNGLAKYEIEGDAIVGTTAAGSPNSFLCTKKEYGDFVLEFDVSHDTALNTGVQIRSHRYAEDTVVNTFDGTKISPHKQSKGRVYGYQVEIANEAAHGSGGIYDEARRGWLEQPAADSACAKAYHDDQWNHYRVVAMGDSIKTWVNGVECADVVDPLDQTGFIGLQVHQFTGDKPEQVRWRNLRIQDLGRHVWKPIWDGYSDAGWSLVGNGDWLPEGGAVHATSIPGDTHGGFAVTDASFTDVTARVQFKIVKGNSGFFLRCDPKTFAGYEEEIDFTRRTGGFWDAGGRGWVTGPEDNAAVKAGEWNDLSASLHGHRIVFHLNGVKTVDLANDAQGRTEGHIALQVHGDPMGTDIWFRNIEILVPEVEAK